MLYLAHHADANEEYTNLSKLFNTIDVNKDQKLSKEELKNGNIK